MQEKLHPIESARYLGVIVDEKTYWKKRISNKLIRGNAMSKKVL